MEDRFITSNQIIQDLEIENALRPRCMSDYIGQTKVKESLGVYIEAAKNRKESLDHVLLYGPPGLGKTTLSHIIASELNVQIKVTSGPALEKAADLASLLTNMSEGDVLFIDEIHRMSRGVEEILYPAMEDYALDFIIGKGPSARNMRLTLPHFTLIAATTRAGMLTGPLRDRFGVILRLEMYSNEELYDIVKRSAGILKIDMDEEAGREISSRSRGTPRIANRILRRVRDYAEVKGTGVITRAMAADALKMLEIDELGLDYADRAILLTMIEKFNGGPVGIDSIAAASNEDGVTIEDVIEPFLMQTGLITRTNRGRIIMPAGIRHLNKIYPEKHFDIPAPVKIETGTEE